MKKIIYLPLIAFIVLCSCKSNSFSKQRYTNFAHRSNKNTIAKKNMIKTEVPVIENETELTDYPQTASASEAGPVYFVKENLIKPLKSNFNSNFNVTQQENKEIENSKTEFKNKKNLNQKKSELKRVIGTLLKIVLWVIILAVVVGVLLIIVVLA